MTARADHFREAWETERRINIVAVQRLAKAEARGDDIAAANVELVKVKDRYREALVRIVEAPHDDCYAVALAALEEN